MDPHSKKGIRLLILLAGVMYALLVTHALALWFSWYWTYPWFDILTHFWGGACVGLGALWFSKYSRYSSLRIKEYSSATIVIGSILIVGVVWEAYEWIVQAAFLLPLPPNYVPDTLLDLVMDILGAIFGLVLFLAWTPKDEPAPRLPEN